MIDFQEDAIEIDKSALKKLVHEKIEAEQLVTYYEEKFKAAKQSLRNLDEILLPNALKCEGIKEIIFDDPDFSYKVSSKLNYFGRLNIEDTYKMQDFIEYLREFNLHSILKRKLIVHYTEEQRHEINVLRMNLVGKFESLEETFSIHSQTLKAFLRERAEGKAALIKEYKENTQKEPYIDNEPTQEFLTFAETYGALCDVLFNPGWLNMYTQEKVIVKKL